MFNIINLYIILQDYRLYQFVKSTRVDNLVAEIFDSGTESAQ